MITDENRKTHLVKNESNECYQHVLPLSSCRPHTLSAEEAKTTEMFIGTLNAYPTSATSLVVLHARRCGSRVAATHFDTGRKPHHRLHRFTWPLVTADRLSAAACRNRSGSLGSTDGST